MSEASPDAGERSQTEAPASNDGSVRAETNPSTPKGIQIDASEASRRDPQSEGGSVPTPRDGRIGDEADKAQSDSEESGDDTDESEDGDDEDGNSEDEEDDEPRLKYAKLTSQLGAVYRNGDATSAFLVAGDKMIVGTHNGNIHVFQLPTFQMLRVYHAHSASVTSISISPYPPPITVLKPEQVSKLAAQAAAASGDGQLRPGSRQSSQSPAAARRAREPPPIPNIPSNNIHIATSSLDGNVCVQSLIDFKDVQLRNFARPVQAVALSPDYKNDRTYLSGGLAGSLVLTAGAQQGKSTSSTTGSAAAVASGWLGSIGLGTAGGKDAVLHSGEGTISTIKWSITGKYAVWLNEHGIKIIRTRLHLDSADSEDAWKRVGHLDRPQTDEWETMAGVWKGRAEWIDENNLEPPDSNGEQHTILSQSVATERLRRQRDKSENGVEKLLVGWGGIIWIIHVHPGGVGVGKDVGERSIGRAEVIKILRMDCIISGISLYTPRMLLVLAYCVPSDDQDEEDVTTSSAKAVRGHKARLSTASSSSEPSGGIRRRQNHQQPELRLIDLETQAEVDKDVLTVSRYERLSSNDYHLGILPAQNAAAAVSSRGALEAITGFGSDMWNAAINPRALFSSSASVRSKGSGDAASGSNAGGIIGSPKPPGSKSGATHPNLAKPGVKIFIHSPYDCILATKRDLADHLAWLLEHDDYQHAWELVDDHPEIMTAGDSYPAAPSSFPDKSTQTTQGSDDLYEESIVESFDRKPTLAAESEKQRIGEMWIKTLVDEKDWAQAARVAGKVLTSPDKWERWVWTFVEQDKFDEITNFIPTQLLHPPIPRPVYEVVLGHYLQVDKLRFRDLLDRWPTDLFDINTITTALDRQLQYRDVREDSVEGGEKGRDWRVVMESLARLHEASGRQREALKCFVRLQDADSAFRLIREHHLVEAVADDIPSFIGLRVPTGHVDDMSVVEIEEATIEAISLLVDEAQHGLVKPQTVISQLQSQDLNLYTFFYLRGLWHGKGIEEHQGEFRDHLVLESKALLDECADLTVHLFALFDRTLLMSFLQSSTSYSFEKAVHECERAKYIDELVYLYSKTGETKRALYLIIDRLGDVSRAISFAKSQDDTDLWDDLLTYSMDKPKFIRGLLEEVGTAIDPITLVRKIPEGLEIPGLREGLKHIMKEHEIQYSISSGVAKVLRSEVASAQANLRNGQRKGIKFQVVTKAQDHIDVETKDVPTVAAEGDGQSDAGDQQLGQDSERVKPRVGTKPAKARRYQAGHCAECLEPFTEWETQTLVGFACGHVYHLAHLLERLHPDETHNVVAGSVDEYRGGRHTVGAKVTHARLLRDKVAGGCPICLDAK